MNDRDDLIDLIEQVISDSVGADWTSREAARAVMDMLWSEGLLPLNADEQLMIEGAWQEHKAAGPRCEVPPAGWFCSRDAGHEGPCAARPVGEFCRQSPWRIHIIDTSLESGPHNCFHCGEVMP